MNYVERDGVCGAFGRHESDKNKTSRSSRCGSPCECGKLDFYHLCWLRSALANVWLTSWITVYRMRAHTNTDTTWKCSGSWGSWAHWMKFETFLSCRNRHELHKVCVEKAWPLQYGAAHTRKYEFDIFVEIDILTVERFHTRASIGKRGILQTKKSQTSSSGASSMSLRLTSGFVCFYLAFLVFVEHVVSHIRCSDVCHSLKVNNTILCQNVAACRFSSCRRRFQTIQNAWELLLYPTILNLSAYT